MVWQDGQPIPPQTPLPGMSAGKLSELLTGWIFNALSIGYRSGYAAAAQAVVPPVFEAGARAGAAAMAKPAAEAGVQAGMLAGTEFGAKYILANTVIHKDIEHDENGRITGILEKRVPAE